MNTQTLRSTAAKVLAPLIGIAVASTMIFQASNAAFTASTSNTANTYSAASVTLVDDDSGSAMMTLSNMIPGDTATKCIAVTYTGSTFSVTPIKLYAALASEVDSFAGHLDVVVKEGAGGTFSDCTGFTAGSTLFTGTLSSLAATHGTYAAGLTAFTPASGSVTRTYQFSVTLGTDTPDTAQGDSVSASFTWEIHSA